MARWLTLRFHSPLIEPDGRISRIRLSDKNSRLRPRKVSRSITQANEAEFVMQPRVGESCRPATVQLVLPPKPLAEPMPRVAVNGSIGRAHGPKTEVVRPTQKLPVQFRHPVLDCRPQPTAAGQLVDLGLEAVDLLRRRLRTDVRPTRPRRVTSSDRVIQE